MSFFLDRLGVKGSWGRGDAEEVLASWNWTLQWFIRAKDEIKAYTEVFDARPEVVSFSDTIIITLDCGGDPRSWNFMPMVVNQIAVPFAMAMFRRVFLRGVISVGEFSG